MVQPHPRPTLAVGRVIEQPVDGPLVSVGSRILDEAVDFLGGGRKPRSPGSPGEERIAVGLRAKASAPLSPVGRGSNRRCRFGAMPWLGPEGGGGDLGADPRPLPGVISSLLDPAARRIIDLGRGESFAVFSGGCGASQSSSVTRKISCSVLGRPVRSTSRRS